MEEEEIFPRFKKTTYCRRVGDERIPSLSSKLQPVPFMDSRHWSKSDSFIISLIADPLVSICSTLHFL